MGQVLKIRVCIHPTKSKCIHVYAHLYKPSNPDSIPFSERRRLLVRTSLILSLLDFGFSFLSSPLLWRFVFACALLIHQTSLHFTPESICSVIESWLIFFFLKISLLFNFIDLALNKSLQRLSDSMAICLPHRAYIYVLTRRRLLGFSSS
jgi:hypothetical protein